MPFLFRRRLVWTRNRATAQGMLKSSSPQRELCMEYRTAATSIRVSRCPAYCRRNRQSPGCARAESAGGYRGSTWRAVSSSITPGLGLTRRRWGAAESLPHRVHSSPAAHLCKFGSSLSPGVDGSADEALELSSHSRLSDDQKQLPLERAVLQIIASPRLADMGRGLGAQAIGANRNSPFPPGIHRSRRRDRPCQTLKNISRRRRRCGSIARTIVAIRIWRFSIGARRVRR
jgi:hypothetical protein